MWQPDFALSYLPDFHLDLFWKLGFWIFSYGLKHLGTLGFHPSASFPSLIIIPLLIHLKIILGIFFLNEKYSFFFSKTLAIWMSSKATLISLAHKNLRKFPNILWTLGHLPEKKYFSTFWNIFATENIFCSGQKWWFLHQLPFYLLPCAWIFLCIITLVDDG